MLRSALFIAAPNLDRRRECSTLPLAASFTLQLHFRWAASIF